jgi:sugar phosphate isomerase/epimerase
MHALSLHHLSVMDVSAFELVELAARLDCAHVCLFTFQPGDGVGLPLVRDEDVEPLRRRMRDAGVTALGTTSFALAPDTEIASYEAGVERSARLGAAHANCRVIDDDEARATDNFVRFAEFCTRRGLLPAIEPSGFENSDALPEALRMFEAAGGGILTLDPLHITRTGTPWEAVEALDPALIGYVQFCDGPLTGTAEAYPREGALDRLPLGEGEYPLDRLLGVTPPGMPISLEIPCQRLREQGFKGSELAAEIVRRSRGWLAARGAA